MGSYFVPVLVLIIAIGAESAQVVNVDVYYESLCPDSKNFITNQLTPVYKSYEDQINLNLVPFGRENVTLLPNGTYEFVCQHGPEECYGNQYHSCAIEHFDVNKSTRFIECSMSSDDPASDETLSNCTQQIAINYEVLLDCYLSGEGAKLLVSNGEKTNAATIPFIPTIIFNSEFNQTSQDRALSDFQGIVEEFLLL